MRGGFKGSMGSVSNMLLLHMGYPISNVPFLPRDRKLKSLDVFNFPSQVEYKKEEGTFLLFEVQMLQLATVVGSALVCFFENGIYKIKKLELQFEKSGTPRV